MTLHLPGIILVCVIWSLAGARIGWLLCDYHHFVKRINALRNIGDKRDK